ncbi:MAG: hypothetical protein LIP06_14095 [Tannerellaceae bacterium]|nr:hypothetical protein [Tannerellaceae bacterium]
MDRKLDILCATPYFYDISPDHLLEKDGERYTFGELTEDIVQGLKSIWGEEFADILSMELTPGKEYYSFFSGIRGNRTYGNYKNYKKSIWKGMSVPTSL